MLEILSVVRSRRHYPTTPRSTEWCTHHAQVISLHLVGDGRFIIGGEELLMRPPLLAVVAAGERNGNCLMGASDAWWCKFNGQALFQIPGGKAVTVSLGTFSICSSHIRRIDHGVATQCATLFQDLRHHASRPGLYDSIKASAILSELLAQYIAPTQQKRSRDPVDNYRVLIAERLDSDVSLPDLATQAGGHPDALGASFRRRYGLTPVAYRLRLRLQLAGKMLLGNRVTVAEAAKAAGFSDPAYFARAFKRSHGLTPRDWAHR